MAQAIDEADHAQLIAEKVAPGEVTPEHIGMVAESDSRHKFRFSGTINIHAVPDGWEVVAVSMDFDWFDLRRTE